MFRLHDNFTAYDKNKQPYTFSVERHTELEHLHAGVVEDGFSLKSVGNRFILNAPDFTTGKFSMDFKITYMEEVNPEIRIICQYDETTRCGKCIDVKYDLAGILYVSLRELKGRIATNISTEMKREFVLKEDELCSLSLEVGEHTIICNIGSEEFVFDCEGQKGKFAIERDNFIGEFIINNIRFESEDEFVSKNIYQNEFTIPCINGGDIPYTVSCRIDEVEGECYMLCSLDGGTRTREVKREERLGQYVAEKDWMTSPYIGIGSQSGDMIFNIAEGENCFIDPNIFWDCQKGFFYDTELPIVNWYKLGKFEFREDMEIIFGYEKLECSGYGTQIGGSEFRFSTDGVLLYQGDALNGNDIYEVLSPFDKFALTLIPKECYQREEVEEHIRYNHYFEQNEDISFTLKMRTKADMDYFCIKAALLNVYETEKLACTETIMTQSPWRNGYSEISAEAHFEKLPIGVYKVEFLVYYGDDVYKRIVKTFEVFGKDSEECPPLASGLPFVFSMPNEQKWLMRNSFDLWNPMHSCNVEHYISCVTDTPIEAGIRKTWEVIEGFKRTWFAWLTSRTANDYLSDKYEYVLKHADYIMKAQLDTGIDLGSKSMLPIKLQHWAVGDIFETVSEEKEILQSFLRERPEIDKEIQYEELMTKYLHEWILYVNARNLELIDQHNEDMKKVNPNAKRSAYGPIGVYYEPTMSYYSTIFNGLPYDEDLAEKVFTGFAVFEDYPYSCSYQTYRGAFAAMTLLLHCPELTLYPEQYSGSRGGCIDGAVKFGNPPMGACQIEAYQISTHAFEYVFNTAYRLKDGFHYWTTYGFHRADYDETLMEKVVMDWKYVDEYKPKKPLRSIAFLAEYSKSDDEFEIIPMPSGEKKYAIDNQSEVGQCAIYECSRLAGVPNGFSLKFETLKDIKADECDVMVLPSLKNVDEVYISEIRRLYDQGVNLIAVSDVTGLEDLFGVYDAPQKVQISHLKWEDKEEIIRPMEAGFRYLPNSAKTMVFAEDNIPAVLCTERTVLINTNVKKLGSSDCKHMSEGRSAYLVSPMMREVLIECIRRLSSTLALSEEVGLTLFETEKGQRVLLAVDYTPFDNAEHKTRQAVVHLNMDDIVAIKSDHHVLAGKKDGSIKELRFNIRPHESVFIELHSM